MSDDAQARFTKLLATRHAGEVSGEAVFAGLANGTEDAGQRHKWRVCEALERETKELLARELAQRGERVDENPEHKKQGEELGARLARVPWNMLLTRLRPELVKFVDEYAADEAAAPADGLALAQHITRHERALLEFVDRELALLAQPPAR